MQDYDMERAGVAQNMSNRAMPQGAVLGGVGRGLGESAEDRLLDRIGSAVHQAARIERQLSDILDRFSPVPRAVENSAKDAAAPGYVNRLDSLQVTLARVEELAGALSRLA